MVTQAGCPMLWTIIRPMCQEEVGPIDVALRERMALMGVFFEDPDSGLFYC